MILPTPMLLHESRRLPPFGQPGWLYELKFDGYRMMAGVDQGEVCVLDELGRSDYNRLRERAVRRCFYPECDPVVFCAFDLLALDGRSIIGFARFHRTAVLGLIEPAECIRPCRPKCTAQYHVPLCWACR